MMLALPFKRKPTVAEKVRWHEHKNRMREKPQVSDITFARCVPRVCLIKHACARYAGEKVHAGKVADYSRTIQPKEGCEWYRPIEKESVVDTYNPEMMPREEFTTPLEMLDIVTNAVAIGGPATKAAAGKP